MSLKSCHRSVRWLAPLAAVVALSPAIPTSSLMVHAQTAAQAAPAAHPDGANSAAPAAASGAASGSGQVAAVHQGTAVSPASAPQQPANAQPANVQPTAAQPVDAPQPKSLTTRAIDKVKQVAKSASDIFNRVPCLPPKVGAKSFSSLPHVASKLAAGKPVVIVAFGSSSTQGYGSSSPEYTYPNRLAVQLHRQYPAAAITVVNAGVGGEDAPEMAKRLQSTVIDQHPDLVIWQVGTNAVLRDLDPTETAKLVEDGVSRIQAAGSDVVLVDPQYSPRMIERPESANKVVRMLGRIAELHHVGIFPRYEVMRDWHERQAIPINDFVISDGLHMNDWGYACFAQLLGDDIIKSVGQVKLGVNAPSDVLTFRPM